MLQSHILRATGGGASTVPRLYDIPLDTSHLTGVSMGVFDHVRNNLLIARYRGTVASGGPFIDVHNWTGSAYERQPSYTFPNESVSRESIAISPDSSHIFVGRYASSTPRFYKLESSNAVDITPAGFPAARLVSMGAYSPNGTVIAILSATLVGGITSYIVDVYSRSGDDYSLINSWDVLSTDQASNQASYAIEFSSDGAHIVTVVRALNQNSVNIFDISGTLILSPEEYNSSSSTAMAVGAAYSPDGKFLVVRGASSAPTTVYAIDDGEYEEIQTIPLTFGFSATFPNRRHVVFAPDSRHLIMHNSSSGAANEIFIFRVNPDTGNFFRVGTYRGALSEDSTNVISGISLGLGGQHLFVYMNRFPFVRAFEVKYGTYS